MPQLLLLTVCERAIHGVDGSLSLIGILTGANLNVNIVGLEQYLDKPATAPVNWSICTIWSRINEPELEFKQYGAIFSPSGIRHDLNPFPFDFKKESKMIHRLIGIISDFPVNEPGIYTIGVGLSPVRNIEEAKWSTWINVVHKTEP